MQARARNEPQKRPWSADAGAGGSEPRSPPRGSNESRGRGAVCLSQRSRAPVADDEDDADSGSDEVMIVKVR